MPTYALAGQLVRRLGRSYLLGLILLVALVVVAGMTIRGGYMLRIRSQTVDILLSPFPSSETQEPRSPAPR
jgi:hypothetical protein